PRHCLLLILERLEADLDEFVIEQRLVEGGDERLGDPRLSDMNDRLEVMRPGFEFAQAGTREASFAHNEAAVRRPRRRESRRPSRARPRTAPPANHVEASGTLLIHAW